LKKEKFTGEIEEFAKKALAVYFTLTPAQLDFYLRNTKKSKDGIAKVVIKDFCIDARNILEKEGIQIPPDKNIKRDELSLDDIYNLYFEGTEKDILLSNARRVIGSAKDCCIAIEKGNAESAAIEMMRLCFAITSMAMQETIFQGIATKAGQSTGGEKSPKLKGVKDAIRERLQINNYTAGVLWLYFKRQTPLVIDEYEICMKEDHANEKNPARLYQKHETQKEQSITLKTFKKYVSEVKKELQHEELIKEILSFSPPDCTKEMLLACFPRPE